MTTATERTDSSAAPRERQILALDGGGVRGVISIAFLERIEALCARAPGGGTLLADRFDLIGGTSTGAVIATALALGLTARDIKEYYFQLAARVFRRSRWRIAGLQALFDARALDREIARVFGERTLDTPDLRTHVAIVMKRMDTGSSWIVSNCARAKFWDDPADGSYIGNRHYRLASLVRASTAAPYFFAPEPIAVVQGKAPGLFIDGGVSPHNNPALALLQVATLPAFGLTWPIGAGKLRIITVGTGRFRPTMDPLAASRMTALGLAVKALSSMISDGQEQAMTMLQLLGQTDTPWTINSEIGDLRGARLTADPLFTFQRYDVRLERAWLREELGFDVTDARVEQLRRMDSPDNVPMAYEIGCAAAEKLVRAEHLFGAPAAVA